MGFFDGLVTTVRDVADFAGSLVGIPTREDRDKANRMMNDQIRAYREQTELSKKELDRLSKEKATEKRRIEEKQIRALRTRSSSRGLLGGGGGTNPSSAGANESGMANKLGG